MLIKYFIRISFLACITALICAHFFSLFNSASIFILFILALFFLLVCIYFYKIKKSDCIALIFLALSIFLLFTWRYFSYLNNIDNNLIFNYVNSDIQVVARIAKPTYFKNNRYRVVLNILYIRINDSWYECDAKVLVFLQDEKDLLYNDVILSNLILKRGEFVSGFNYPLYLKKEGIQLLSYDLDIWSLYRSGSFNIYSALYLIRGRVLRSLSSNLSSESLALSQAMLLADKSMIDEKMQALFSISGVSHLIAISGLHISLIVVSCWYLFLFIGCNRKIALVLLVVLILSYLIIISYPASALRASLMSFLSLVALLNFRHKNIANILLFSALVMLFFNPLFLFIDIAFQLSFIAVLAIIYLHPVINWYLHKVIVCKKVSLVLDLLSITISISILSFPLLVYYFQIFSLISPLSNLLLLWTIPFIFLFILIALISSLFWPLLTDISFVLLEILLSYFYFVLNSLSKLSFAYIEIFYLSPRFIISYYLLVFIFIYINNKKTDIT